jgi:hypothetical protein
VLVDFDGQAEVRQQPFDAVGMLGGLLPERDQFAVQLASVLLFGSGNLDHAPELCLAAGVAEQHAQQLLHVEAVTLGTSSPTVDLDARRIDH